MCLNAPRRLCTRARVTALNSSVIAGCVRPQSCLFTLVWRSHQQSLLPPFLSDEAAYLAAPLRLSYFCFAPQSDKVTQEWRSRLQLSACEAFRDFTEKTSETAPPHTHTRVCTYVHVKHTIVRMHSYVHWENSQLMLIQAYGSCVLDHD